MSRVTSAIGLAAVGVFATATVVAAQPSSASAHRASGGLRFSHEVVVDQQRSGFEPDVAIDGRDRYYSTVPNGSSTAHSFVWESRDHGKSYQLIPGQVGLGKPTTCPQGGGDTELQLDKKGDLFFSDLQNLTNLSNSVSTNQGSSWNTGCASVPNSPVDRMWYAVHGNLGDPGFAIYEEYDDVLGGLNPTGTPLATVPSNQLVETVSHDGVNFQPVVNARLAAGKIDPDCVGGGDINCVTDNEGIPGNQVIAPNGDILIAHTSSDGPTFGNKIIVSRGHLTTGPGGVVMATWKHYVLNASLCPDKPNAAPGICSAANFATIAEDSAGHFYVAFSSQKFDKNDNPVGPYQVYVVASKDGYHWGAPRLVSRGGSNAFSWVTAGSNGRIAVAWYHANESHEGTSYYLDDLTHAEISVQVGESLNALSSHPGWAITTVSEHPIKYGPICTKGTNCTVTMGDRSLGDFLEVNHDARGALALSYVDDTSNTYSVGPTGAVAENGPVVIVKQIAGPSLVKGTITGPGNGPGAPWGHVTDVTGDDDYSANGSRSAAGANLDLTGASIRTDSKGLVVTMQAKSLASLTPAATAGGTTGEWITRFTTFNPHTPGNGHIYYAGMESVGGGSPRFFVGDAAPAPAPPGEQVSMLFDSSTSVAGAVQGDTITIHVPYSAIPAAKASGVLYSAMAFSATTDGTLAKNPAGVFNLTDATPPFDVALPGSHPAVAGALPWRDVRIPLSIALAVLLAWSAWSLPLPVLRRRPA